MASKTILILGGSGFVGSAMVQELASAKKRIYALINKTPISNKLVHSISANINDPADLLSKFSDKNIDTVIYSIGLLKESKQNKFSDFHFKWLRNAVFLAEQINAERFILISANGIDGSPASYSLTKLQGEQDLKKSTLNWTILRPSLIIGESTKFSFLSLLKQLTCFPIVPVIANTKPIQPVLLSDLTRALISILDNQASTKKTYCVCGPQKYSFADLMLAYLRAKNINRLIVPIPNPFFLALSSILQHLPLFPASREQIQMLIDGNSCDDNTIWEVTGIKPKDVFTN